MEPDDDRTDDDGPSPSEPGPSGAIAVGPVLGVLIGLVVLKLLPGTMSLVVKIAIVVAVIAVAAWVSVQVARRNR